MEKAIPRALLAVMLGLLGNVVNTYAAGPPLQQGEAILAFDPAAITELSAQAVGLRVIAHRWNPESPFYISVFMQAGVSTCRGGSGLMQVLRSLQSLRVIRTLSNAETRQVQDTSSLAIHLRFTATTDVDLGEWTFYLPRQNGAHVLVQSEHMDRAAEVPIGSEPFVLITQGCRSLGKSSSRPPQ